MKTQEEKDKCAAYMREYNSLNRSAINAARRAKRKVSAGFCPNRQVRAAATRRWREGNPEKVRQGNRTKYLRTVDNRTEEQWAAEALRCRLRAHKRRSAPGLGVSSREWVDIFESFGGMCAYCLGPAQELDHIVPLSKGGLHQPDNCVPACAKCNRRKSSKSLLSFTFPLHNK